MKKIENSLANQYTKAELPLKGIFFALKFLSWEFILVKKLEIETTKATKYTTFKTDIIKVVFQFPTFLLMKIPREEN